MTVVLLGPPGPGTSVMQVMASDADDPTYGSSARLVYSVLDGEHHFTVDPKTGEGGPGTGGGVRDALPRQATELPDPAMLRKHRACLWGCGKVGGHTRRGESRERWVGSPERKGVRRKGKKHSCLYPVRTPCVQTWSLVLGIKLIPLCYGIIRVFWEEPVLSSLCSHGRC